MHCHVTLHTRLSAFFCIAADKAGKPGDEATTKHIIEQDGSQCSPGFIPKRTDVITAMSACTIGQIQALILTTNAVVLKIMTGAI